VLHIIGMLSSYKTVRGSVFQVSPLKIASLNSLSKLLNIGHFESHQYCRSEPPDKNSVIVVQGHPGSKRSMSPWACKKLLCKYVNYCASVLDE
ncbi:hypothetical protein, partial [Glutamicibacter ardleyensis]|uniref:hypothetical protein n=1 Tax=Glutamicibacter ardleyensis TaxID=225894 RepID=UPI003FD6AEA7